MARQRGSGNWYPQAAPLALLCSLACVAIAAADSSAAGQEIPARYALLGSSSRVWFDARASLGSFQGVAGVVQGWARFSDRDLLHDASAEIRIDVASFRTGNGTRDRHLRETMEVDSFPSIVWRLLRATVMAGDGDRPAAVELNGTLTIKRTTREVVIPTALQFAGDTVLASGSLPIRLTDYGISPPRRVIGMIRMSNDLLLRFEAAFVLEDAPSEEMRPAWRLPTIPGTPHISRSP